MLGICGLVIIEVVLKRKHQVILQQAVRAAVRFSIMSQHEQ